MNVLTSHYCTRASRAINDCGFFAFGRALGLGGLSSSLCHSAGFNHNNDMGSMDISNIEMHVY